MEIEEATYELFKTGTRFDQVTFLDNFYYNIDIEKHSGSSLEKFLFSVLHTTDSYIKRVCITIISELHLIGKMTNTYKILGAFYDVFDNEKDPFVLAASLRYFPLITDQFSQKDKNRIIGFTEHDTGDVASEAYYAVGLMYIGSITSADKPEDVTATLVNARRCFNESSLVSENRSDADFIDALIMFMQTFISNDVDEATKHLKRAHEIFIYRQVYELNEVYLELDLIVFEIFEKMLTSLEVLHSVDEWINYSQELYKLIRVNKQVEKLKKKSDRSAGIVSKFYSTLLKQSLDILYRTSFPRDRKRIERVNEQGGDAEIIFITEQILRVLPLEPTQNDNISLLSSIIEHYGKEKGLELYNKVKGNPEKMITVILEVPPKNNLSVSNFLTGSIYGQEVYQYLKMELEKAVPDYPKDKMAVFLEILEEVIRYTKMALTGSAKSDYLFLYSTAEGGKGDTAVEGDLQDHLFNQLQLTKLAYGFEHEKARFADGGRVDIVFKVDQITIPIELKRTTSEIDIESIEANYIAQAQTYASGYDQLGIFVLLDLTAKGKKPGPNFKDLFHIHHLKPSTELPIRYPDHIISVVIQGNKLLPSSKSTYK